MRIFDIHKVIWPLSFLFILLIIHVHFNIVQGNVQKQIIYFLWKSLFAATPKLVIGLEYSPPPPDYVITLMMYYAALVLRKP